jgi:hypothetical protein
VTLNVINVFPDSDYTGRLDIRASARDSINLRYQYSRQIRESGRIVFGDNFGTNNNRQYNIGSTWTHVFSNRQVGEFRYGFGNRSTLQDVADDNAIPTIRFSNTLCAVTGCNFVIGTSTNVPINRRQHDQQFVYNHTITLSKHALKMGIDQRYQLLDDVTGDRSRGFWTFSSLDTAAQIQARTGFTGWENFLKGFVTGYQRGFGNPKAENRFGETNIYFEDNTFTNITEKAGVGEIGLCLGTVFGDYNEDGYADLYVVNDFGRKTLYRNNRNGTFTDVTVETGTLAYGAGMNASFGDYDNDGHLDLFLANGHPDDMIELYSQQVKYKEPLLLFHNTGQGRLQHVSAQSGPVL